MSHMRIRGSADHGDEPKSDYHEEKLTVETVYNHVYFYSAVDSDRCLDLIKQIREIDSSLRDERESRMLPKDFPMTPIWLHVQSGGGDIFTGLNISSQLKHIASPIYSIVEGYAASCATLITIPCTRRFILPSSYMLIHQISSWFMGKYEELKNQMELIEMFQQQIAELYVEYSNMSMEQVKELIQKESWLPAKKCIELGLVDEII